MDSIQLLNEKIDALLQQYKAAQAENAQLKATVAQQLSDISALNVQLSALEERMKSVPQVPVNGSTDNAALRTQLDNVIGKIDKMIASLNA